MTDLSRWTDEELAMHDTPPAQVRAEIERRRGRVIAATSTPPSIQQLQEAYAVVDRERNQAIKQRDDANRTRNEAQAFVSELKASNLQLSQRIAELEERAIKQAQQRANLPNPVVLYPRSR
jgi:hypothetical protein